MNIFNHIRTVVDPETAYVQIRTLGMIIAKELTKPNLGI